MTIRDVLLPLFVEVILTFVLLFWTSSLRDPNRPAPTTQAAEAFRSELELPVLYYVLTILAWDTHHAGYLFVALAWVFVILRVIHAGIFAFGDNARGRGTAFILSAIVLAIMWAIYIVEIVVGV
jgi:hypothetical protein